MIDLLALSTAASILAWVTIAVALVGALAVTALLARVAQPALEIKRYADDILRSTQEIPRNVEGVNALARTRDLATALPELGVGYLEREGTGPR